jgi:hypothetical protein
MKTGSAARKQVEQTHNMFKQKIELVKQMEQTGSWYGLQEVKQIEHNRWKRHTTVKQR